MESCVRIGEVPSFLSPELAAFMHRVDASAGDDWYFVGLLGNNYFVPRDVRSRCGYCNGLQFLKCSGYSFNAASNSITFKALCADSDCKKESTVILVDAVKSSDRRPKEFWILPAPKFRDFKIDIALIVGPHSDRISNNYKSAINLYNSSEYIGSIASSGRLLEAIGKTKLIKTSSKSSIGKLFKKLEKSLDDKSEFSELIRPFLSLGEALRLGRNPSDHFDLAVEPDQNLSEKILELIEFLLTYIYVIPGESERVEEMIKACNPADADADYQNVVSDAPTDCQGKTAAV